MPRAPKLAPLAGFADQSAALALAVTRLRTESAWTTDAAAETLCELSPPFGIRDQLGRIRGILWSADGEGASGGARSQSESGDGGRRLGRVAAPPPNQTEVHEACLRLAHALKNFTSRPTPALYGSCAVVGSSGGLSGSGQGALIDSHDAVVRFNSAPTGGVYGADVGNRTSIWVASHIPWRGQARRTATLPHEAAGLYCFNPWLGACHAEAIRAARMHVYGPLYRPFMVSPALAAAVMRIQVALGGKTGGSVRPSTGLIGVGLALASCARVSLFGFGNDTDPSHAAHCNHYYDCRTNQTNYFAGRMGYHDWHGQWRALAALIDLGAIRYHPPTGPPRTYTLPAAKAKAAAPTASSAAGRQRRAQRASTGTGTGHKRNATAVAALSARATHKPRASDGSGHRAAVRRSDRGTARANRTLAGGSARVTHRALVLESGGGRPARNQTVGRAARRQAAAAPA